MRDAHSRGVENVLATDLLANCNRHQLLNQDPQSEFQTRPEVIRSAPPGYRS